MAHTVIVALQGKPTERRGGRERPPGLRREFQ